MQIKFFGRRLKNSDTAVFRQLKSKGTGTRGGRDGQRKDPAGQLGLLLTRGRSWL